MPGVFSSLNEMRNDVENKCRELFVFQNSPTYNTDERTKGCVLGAAQLCQATPCHAMTREAHVKNEELVTEPIQGVHTNERTSNTKRAMRCASLPGHAMSCHAHDRRFT